ncbi:MAG TPA: ABC transporter permease [Vicinamibacterales bacterium]|nr:ABC transporter permease [Vicinamibacterales bacterium]
MLNDLRQAVRWLLRSPGFAAVAILSLGLGIGANTAMFSLVDAVLLRPIPVEDPGTLVDVFTNGSDGGEYATTSYPDFLDLEAQNTVFSDITAYSMMLAPLNLGDRARLVMGHIVTSNHFTLLGIRPFLGRTLQPADDVAGAERVVVISHRMWRSDYGSDRSVIGKTLQLRGQAYTIVGVAPASFTGVVPILVPELWLPILHADEIEPAGINDNVPSPTGRTRLERRGSRWLFVKGRLKPGMTVAAARANVEVLAAQLAAAYPETNRNRRMAAFASTDVRLLVPQAGGPLSIGSAGIMAVVGLVLLIACANVTGMLLARASSRQREISVRLAIGAGRWHIVRQMLTEGIVLGVCGAVVAAAIASSLVRLLLSLKLPIPGTINLDVRLDLRVLAFALGVAIVAGVLAALTPALKASSMRLAAELRGDTSSARFGGRRWALRDVLVVGQLALTLVLLVVAGLLLRSLAASQSADVGFRTAGLAMVAADTGMVRYTAEQSERFWARALERVETIPGVESVALVTPRMPFDVNYSQTSIRIDGKAYGPDDRGELVANVAVSPEYFSTLDVPIVEGRGFTDADRREAPPVVVVNETLARRFWPDGSAVGRTFELSFSDGQKFQVVGVSKDHRLFTVNERPAPYLHFAAAQRPSRYNYVVASTRGDASQTLATLRRELLAIEPGLVFVASNTMESALEMSLLPQRVAAWLALAFGGVGTLLAAIGLYGVVAFSVARRTREIGVRMAVGADAGQVLGLVMRQGLALAVIGGAVGVGLAAVSANLLGGLLYQVSAVDVVAWGLALAVLFGAALAANLIPAVRAMRVDPVTALRSE